MPQHTVGPAGGWIPHDRGGGAAALAARAEVIADPRLACELIELAYQAAPDDAAIRAARARLYAARADSERSLMARGIFATTAAGSRK